MLTPDQVDAVSRSIIGHMTTDPAVRAKLDVDPNSAAGAATIANVVNATIGCTPPVTAADVPAIAAAIKKIAQGQAGLEPVNASSLSLFFKSS